MINPRPRLQVCAALLLVGPPLSATDNDLLELFSDVESATRSSEHRSSANPGDRSVGGAFDNFAAVATTTVQIRIDGVRNRQGVVHVLLFADETAFASLDADAAVGYLKVPAASGELAVEIDAYSDGPYAAFAHHDENGNQQLDRQGARPSEGYGYSAVLDPYLPPPFRIAANITTTGAIRMQYLSSRMRR